MEFGPWMGLIAFASGIVWGLITMYFKQIEQQKTQARDKEELQAAQRRDREFMQKSLSGIGGKVDRLEVAMMNDRAADIAGTKEESLRLWKAGIFKEEAKR
jgi:preprotein translocase subunit YajC